MRLSIHGYDRHLITPRIMGILNLTPDSFSGDGLLVRQPPSSGPLETPLERAQAMVAAGAGIIDIGAVSTRPGAEPVSGEEEQRRLSSLPKIARECNVLISLDTSNPAIAEQFAALGVIHIINNIAGDDDTTRRMAEIAAKYRLGLVITHSQREDGYLRIVDQIHHYWAMQKERARTYGVRDSQLIFDPGFGLGKTDRQTQAMLRFLNRLCDFRNRPVLIGASMKASVQRAMEQPRTQLGRELATLDVTRWAADSGAKIIRVHDVPANVQALTEALAPA